MAEDASDSLRWVRRGVLAGVILIGWVFIAWQNKFHITAPVAFVCLGFLAVVMTVVNLWRTGAAAMSPEHEGEEAWSRPIGERGELEKEKKTLLKAIKEAEFDHQMGKLSKADADAMIHTYRARAIAVIKELERFEELDMKNVDPAGRPLAHESDSVRDQIAREVKARLELANANKKQKKKAATKDAETPKVEEPESKSETAPELRRCRPSTKARRPGRGRSASAASSRRKRRRCSRRSRNRSSICRWASCRRPTPMR